MCLLPIASAAAKQRNVRNGTHKRRADDGARYGKRSDQLNPRLLPCRRERNLLVSLVTGSCMLDAVVRSKDLDDAKSTEQSDEGEVLKVGQQRYYERANDGDGIDNVQDALGH
eukprot:7371594-Prymnesium_polylepis.1